MDKKVVKCIYTVNKKGGNVLSQQQETSSWWSTNKEPLPDSDVFKDVLDSSHNQLSLDGVEGEANEDNVDEDVTQNQWQTGMYQKPGEEGELIGVNSPPSLRRSTRIRKQNPKFGEASSWWSANKELLPDSYVFKDVLDSSHIQLSLDGVESEANEDNIDEDVTQNLWQTGMYQQPGEESELIGANSPPSLRRSTRIRKKNPKFANATIVEDENEKEPETFEEAFQNPKWIRAMEEEIVALQLNQTWELVTKPRDAKRFEMKKLGHLNHFLSLEVDRSAEGIFLNQPKTPKIY
ncbi:hypothetical protein KY285_005164 [Solanum tuberosum]|nr:hypothetical protein KY284_006609 [Solanum tuberosum]KAH0752016.1 hypothetical protein KY285_005164 [Solanum tuberosum]